MFPDVPRRIEADLRNVNEAHDKQDKVRAGEQGDVNMETKLLGGDRSKGKALRRADGGRERVAPSFASAAGSKGAGNRATGGKRRGVRV